MYQQKAKDLLGYRSRPGIASTDGDYRVQQMEPVLSQLDVTQGMAKMKPHIKYWKHGLWECVGFGLHSLAKSPAESFSNWKAFCVRMDV